MTCEISKGDIVGQKVYLTSDFLWCLGTGATFYPFSLPFGIFRSQNSATCVFTFLFLLVMLTLLMGSFPALEQCGTRYDHFLQFKVWTMG